MLRAKRIDVLISNDRVLENFYQNEKIHPGGSPEIVPLDRGLKKPWNPPRAVAPHSEG